MSCVYKGKDVVVGQSVPLRQALAIGRQISGVTADMRRDDGAECLFLTTESVALRELDPDSCQVLVTLAGDAFCVENQNPVPGAATLNGADFRRSRLLVGDRLTVGDQFHFQFDGNSLWRVAELQGAQIDVHHVVKTYGEGKRAISDITLGIAPNKFVGILGPSGSGKSTFMNMLSGVIRPSSGTVQIGGVDIHKFPEYRQNLVGMVPQDDIVHPDLTVWQAANMAAKLRLSASIPRRELPNLAGDVIARLGLWEWRHHPVGKLSGGQRKRASIAVELLRPNGVLFLDEPTSGLDPSKEQQLMQHLRQMADQGQTVVCTTHTLDSAHLFHLILIIVRGVCVYFGKAEDAPAYFGTETLHEVYRKIDERNYDAVPFGTRKPVVNTTSSHELDPLGAESFESMSGGEVSFSVTAAGAVVRVSDVPKNPGRLDNLLKKILADDPALLILDLTTLAEVPAALLTTLENAVHRASNVRTGVKIVSPDPSVTQWVTANRWAHQIHVAPSLSELGTLSSDQVSEPSSGGGAMSALVLAVCLALFGVFLYVLMLVLK